LSLFWLVLGSPPSLLAHDIPQRSFDRAIVVTIHPNRLVIAYHLGVSRLTVADELLSLVGAGGLAGTSESDRLTLYATNMGTLLANGLLLQVDDRPVELSIHQTSHAVDDHPRFQFEFVAPIEVSDRGLHRMRIEDTSFFLEKGRLRIAIRAEQPCEMQSCTVPAHLDEVHVQSAWEMTPEQQDAARRAEANWDSTGSVADSTSDSARETTGPVPQTRNETRRSGDLIELLDRWSGQYLAVLLCLAFFFGAAHALTPGHGKTMVAAYLVGERGTMRHALALGLTTSMTHTSSVLGVAFILRLLNREVQDHLTGGFALLSGVLVAGLGACLLFDRLRSARLQRSRARCETQGTAGSSPDAVRSSQQTEPAPGWTNLLTFGVSGGMVPCSDAIALLFIATAKGQVEQAVYLLLSFSAGLASALVLVGVLAVQLRGFLASPLGTGRIVQALPVVSAATIFGVGVYLCFRTLGQLGVGEWMVPATMGLEAP
jgi:ABC-type nickel/cobalt efflux system permease component RcnA